ncbi:hypothetical protein TPE_0703 [Treponema pedis str. T A4]|uniref:Uncharacterized protein n=1 Tax=Treponema pedis str. T A4 TaxID=1291379 RepID=S6A847_9SPIR|nr:hypothetical protein TPE_0703 [Treponema pedis str. T A4]
MIFSQLLHFNEAFNTPAAAGLLKKQAGFKTTPAAATP